MMSAGAIVARRSAVRAILPFTGSDRLPGARGLVPVSELCAGDTLRTEDGGEVTIVAVARQAAPDPAYCVGLPIGRLDARLPVRDILLPEDQRILIETPVLEALCGSSRALVRMGDLVPAGLGHRVPFAEEPRYHLVLDRPALLPFHGIALEPLAPCEATLAGLEAEERVELFAQAPRLRYAAAREEFVPDLPILDVREVTLATAEAWTCGAEAGKVDRDQQPISMTVACAPGTSGPQLSQPYSGRSPQPRITC